MTKTQLILAIIQSALTGLMAIPATAPEAAIGSLFMGILTNGMAAYQAETGVPLDVTKIPLEVKVP